MKPSEFFAALEDVGVPMDESILGLPWGFQAIRTDRPIGAILRGGTCLTWRDTPQGFAYWLDIRGKLLRP